MLHAIPKWSFGMMSNRMITIWRIMVAGTRNFFRNAWLSAAATAVMVVTLTVMLSAIALNLALKDTLTEVKKKIDVAIFFEDKASEGQIDSLQTQLKTLENVQSIHF